MTTQAHFQMWAWNGSFQLGEIWNVHYPESRCFILTMSWNVLDISPYWRSFFPTECSEHVFRAAHPPTYDTCATKRCEELPGSIPGSIDTLEKGLPNNPPNVTVQCPIWRFPMLPARQIRCIAAFLLQNSLNMCFTQWPMGQRVWICRYLKTYIQISTVVSSYNRHSIGS